jgi:hypothetical protein
MTIKTTIDTSARTITFTPSTGTPYVFDVAKMHPAMREYAILHGMKQRLGDNAAISTKDGVKPTDDDKMAAIRSLGAHYESGSAEWNTRALARRAVGAAVGGIVLRAVAAIQNVTVEEMRTRIKTLAERKETTERKLLNALAVRPDVIAKIAELTPEDDSSDGLVDELMA